MDLQRLTALILAAATACLPLRAAGQDAGMSMALCRSPLAVVPPPQLPPGLQPSPATRIWADRAAVAGQQQFEFRGDVLLVQKGESLSADQVLYDKATDEVDARGDVRLHQDGITAEGTRAHVNLSANSGVLTDARYQYDANHAHGRAARIEMESADVTRLTAASLTTCDPGHVFWDLQAGSVVLDKPSGRGHAFNVVFHIKHVPMFYLPYLSFPISGKRKSGFLIPSFSSSTRSGFMIGLPYYLNIAPNLDATVTPRLMTKRGLMAEGQLRYLTRRSHGEIDLQYLPGDRVYGGDRAQLFYDHTTAFTPHLGADWLINYVSDKEYLSDFGNSLSTTSANYLDNHADIAYRGDTGFVTGRLQGYVSVDPSIPSRSLPYQQLPQIVFDYSPVVEGDPVYQEYDGAGEYVRFRRNNRLAGDRLDLRPAVSLPLERQAGFVIPRLSLSHTRYLLHDAPAGQPAALTRTLPIASLDTGLFLERNLRLGGREWIQTLEPRAFYVYIPYTDQSQIPIFDTARPDLNMVQLFSENRFSGPDRIGDANQVSLALTTRLLSSATGREVLSASLGQIVYFRDRKVTLPGQPVERGGTSDAVAEASASMGDNVAAIGDLIWNRNTHDIDRGTFVLRYHGDQYHILDLGYRFVRSQQLRQTDVAFLWPLTRQWHLVGRWTFSLHDKRSLETLGGVEYDSCCWGFRAVWRRFVTTTNPAATGTAGTSSSFLFQAVFKGMTSVGSPIETLLERGILGYQSTL